MECAGRVMSTWGLTTPKSRCNAFKELPVRLGGFPLSMDFWRKVMEELILDTFCSAAQEIVSGLQKFIYTEVDSLAFE